MEDERTESHRGTGIKVIIALLIGLGIGYWVGIKSYIRMEEDAKQPSEEVVAEPQSATKSAVNTGTDADAISLVSYSDDWVDSEAHVSVKNNTDEVITSITGRVIYYDMSGNMLDYQDFKKKLEIEPGMSKKFDIAGYGHDEYFTYYKNKASYSHSENKYKIDFQVKSYTYK